MPDERSRPANVEIGREANHEALEAFQLLPSDIEQILLRAEATAATATRAHPVGSAATLRWIETAAQLRMTLVRKGGSLDNTENISRVITPDGKKSIIVSGGTSDVGLFYTGRHPRTTQPKGEGMRRALLVNSPQIPFDFGLAGVDNPASDEPELWCLLYHRTSPVSPDQPAILQAELSRPSGMDGRGYLNSWKPRYLAADLRIHEPEVVEDAGDEGDSTNVDFDLSLK